MPMERRHEYEALKAAREMSAVETRETLRRIREHRLRMTGDGAIEPPAGFKYIDTAPLDGTFVRIAYRPLRLMNIQYPEAVGQFRNDNGFLGWFGRDGGLLHWPLFWAPAQGSVS